MKKNNMFITASLSVLVLGGVLTHGILSTSAASKEKQFESNDISYANNNSLKSNELSVEHTAKSINSNNSSLKTNYLSVNDKKNKDNLGEYTSEQIEYARVWLQLGPNQAIDELNVQHIKAGTPLNPNDETSALYPEDVIQLSGSRLVDGVVTYSGNGNGTINVYNVPLRWDGSYPAGEKFYTDIIENTKLVSINTGEDEKIIKLIKLLNVYY
ncbi:hypothetical protein ACFC4S_24520 [Priestia megaterium]|uniref:hypothetical protein n=1 Tax=Priestia megaterium TaxID=1404 RepID=UPI0035E109D7